MCFSFSRFKGRRIGSLRPRYVRTVSSEIGPAEP
jgi:hypothetical protein